MKGYFKLRVNGSLKRINFKGVAFGGHYGGHNVNVEISPKATRALKTTEQFTDQKKIDDLLSEVQRRILTGDMLVDFERLKQGQNVDPFGNIAS